MTWQTEKQIITIHILPKITKSKDNQTMKFAQFIEYKMRNGFCKISYLNCGREDSSRPFYKNF